MANANFLLGCSHNSTKEWFEADGNIRMAIKLLNGKKQKTDDDIKNLQKYQSALEQNNQRRNIEEDPRFNPNLNS